MELFTIYLGRFIAPSGLTQPVVLPHYLPAEKKEALLSLLVNGLGSPYLLRFSWPEIRIEPEGNRILVNNTPLNTQGTLIVVRVGSEEEFRKAFKALRRVPALLVIYDATRGGFVQYQKWLYDLNYMLVKAIYEAAEHFGGPQFAEDLDFTFPLENFSDPLDILDFTNRYLEARGEGKEAREAKKEAFGQVLASKVVSLQEEDLTLLLELVTKHTSQVITLHEVEGAEIEALQRLESAGFLILSGRKLMLTAPTLRLRDADFLEKAVLALEKKRGKALGESRKLYEDYLSIVRRPVLEPLPIAEEAAIAVETRFEVPLKEVEKELLKLEEKGIRSKALGLMWQAFASLKDNKVEEALADARLAYETDKELREAYLAFLAYGGEFCLANWRLDEAVEYFRRYEAEGGSSWRVFWGLGQAYHKLGKWERAESFYKQALIKTQEAGEQWGEGAILNDLGNVYAQQGRWEEAIACYEESLRIKRALGDRHGEGQTLTNLGNVYQLQGRWEEAIANYEKALEICRTLGDRQGEGKTLMGLGSVYLQQGRWEEAIANYEKALEIFRALGDRHGEGADAHQPGSGLRRPGPLGRGHRKLRESTGNLPRPGRPPRRGADAHQPGQRLRRPGPLGRGHRKLRESTGNLPRTWRPPRRGATLTNLGNVYPTRAAGKRPSQTTRKHWKSAAPWATATARERRSTTWATSTPSRAAGKRPSQTTRKHWKSSAPWATATARGTLTNLGNVYADQGRWEEAIANYEKALEIFRALGDRHGEGQSAHGPGQRLRRPGPLGRGHRKLRESTGNLPRPGRPPRRGSDAGQPGQRLRPAGPLGRGHRLLRESLEIFRALGDRHGEAQTLGNLGNVYADQGRWEEAIANYEKALEIFRALGDRHGEALTLMNLGNVYRLPGPLGRGHRKLRESTGNLPRPGRPPRRGSDALGNLGNVYRLQGRWEEAIACYEESLRNQARPGRPPRRGGDAHRKLQPGHRHGVYADQGRWEEAIANYEKALEIFRALGDRHGEAQTLMQPGQRLPPPGPLGRGHRKLRESTGNLPRPGRPPRRGSDAQQPGQRLPPTRAAGKRPSPATRKHWKSSANWVTATARELPSTTWPMSMPSKASWKRPWKLPRRPSASLRNSKPTQTS
jgi:tetratricopeptide (TPR) repeat protein